MNHLIKFLLLSTVFVVTSCGGGNDNNTNTTPSNTAPVILKGKFIDSAVTGLGYETATQSGSTNATGEFNYMPGETIVFSIGDIIFNTVTAKTFITPLDIFKTTDINSIDVVNMARLLQSLDADGDATNGIVISPATHLLASAIQINFSDTAFENNSSVINLVANSAAQNSATALSSLVLATDATDHLQQSLIDFNVASSCASTNAKVGFTGIFTTRSHGVAGRVTVIDDCTILLSGFNYDGKGPSVFIYAGTNGNYNPDNSNAFAISGEINGPRYSNSQLVVKIPPGKTLNDFNGISVWCNDFKLNFGDTLLLSMVDTNA